MRTRQTKYLVLHECEIALTPEILDLKRKGDFAALDRIAESEMRKHGITKEPGRCYLRFRYGPGSYEPTFVEAVCSDETPKQRRARLSS